MMYRDLLEYVVYVFGMWVPGMVLAGLVVILCGRDDE